MFKSITTEELEGELGARLRAARLRRNLSQADLAASAGIALGSLRNLEAGIHQGPDANVVNAGPGTQPSTHRILINFGRILDSADNAAFGTAPTKKQTSCLDNLIQESVDE